MNCPAPMHDTLWAYTKHRCRCPAAVEANTRRHREVNAKRTPIIGTRQPGRGRVANPRLDMSRVREAVAGQQVELTSRELAAALDLYDRDGRSAAEVARRLGCTTRTVTRHRARRRDCPQAVSTVVDA